MPELLGRRVVDRDDAPLDVRAERLLRDREVRAARLVREGRRAPARRVVEQPLVVQVDADDLAPTPLHLERPEAVPGADVEAAHARERLRQPVARDERAQVEHPLGLLPRRELDRVVPTHPMLDTSRERILREVPTTRSCSTSAAGRKPFPRADWVVDMKDYATPRPLGARAGRRGALQRRARGSQRDVCDAEPLPFEDDQFDFVVCSQTLEDVRDPVRVCAEIVRVGKAGYIETPSRLEEQSYGVQGPWVGWGHHHWLVEVDGDRIEFVFKHHVMHGRESDHFPDGLPRHAHAGGVRGDALVGGLVRVRRAGDRRTPPSSTPTWPTSSARELDEARASSGAEGGSSSEPRRGRRREPRLVPHDRARAGRRHAGADRPAGDGRQGAARPTCGQARARRRDLRRLLGVRDGAPRRRGRGDRRPDARGRRVAGRSTASGSRRPRASGASSSAAASGSRPRRSARRSSASSATSRSCAPSGSAARSTSSSAARSCCTCATRSARSRTSTASSSPAARS